MHALAETLVHSLVLAITRLQPDRSCTYQRASDQISKPSECHLLLAFLPGAVYAWFPAGFHCIKLCRHSVQAEAFPLCKAPGLPAAGIEAGAQVYGHSKGSYGQCIRHQTVVDGRDCIAAAGYDDKRAQSEEICILYLQQTHQV